MKKDVKKNPGDKEFYLKVKEYAEELARIEKNLNERLKKLDL